MTEAVATVRTHCVTLVGETGNLGTPTRARQWPDARPILLSLPLQPVNALTTQEFADVAQAIARGRASARPFIQTLPRGRAPLCVGGPCGVLDSVRAVSTRLDRRCRQSPIQTTPPLRTKRRRPLVKTGVVELSTSVVGQAVGDAALRVAVVRHVERVALVYVLELCGCEWTQVDSVRAHFIV
jgi:hypothetical protein